MVPGRVTPGDGEKGRRSPCFPEPGAEARGRIAERRAVSPGATPPRARHSLRAQRGELLVQNVLCFPRMDGFTSKMNVRVILF